MSLPQNPDGVREQFGPPRKRRRRATVKSASDCFTCNRLQRRCDRKKPYCTECLEHGTNCSGYKTALTWNIGVASRGKLRGLALPIATSEEVSDQTSENSNFIHAFSSQPSSSSSEHGTKQYTFVNVNSDYSTFGLPPTSSPSVLSNAVGSHHSHSSGISVETSPTATCLAASEQHSRDLPEPLASVASFNGEPFMKHQPMGWSPTATFLPASEQQDRDLSEPLTCVASYSDEPFMRHEPMRWSQSSCCLLNPQQNSSDHMDLTPSPTIPIVMDTAGDIHLDQSFSDIYGFSINDETSDNANSGINLQYVEMDMERSEGWA